VRNVYACGVAVAALAVGSIESVQAQGWFFGGRGYQDNSPYRGPSVYRGAPAPAPAPDGRNLQEGRPPQRKAVAKPKREAEIKKPFGDMPKGPLQLVVSINRQHVTLYSNGHHVAQAPVSTGVPGHPTPVGVFSIIQKDRHHRSNLYSDAPMPYMQRITWSGVALHEGVLPGHPASHGCIRMPGDFARRLWGITNLGVRVIVAREDVHPAEFDHPGLLLPKLKPADAPMVEIDREKRVGIAPSLRFAQTTAPGAITDVTAPPAPSTANRSIEAAPTSVPALPPPSELQLELRPSDNPTVAESPKIESSPLPAGADVETTANIEGSEPAQGAEQAKPATPAPAAATDVPNPDKPAPALFEPSRKPLPLRTKAVDAQKRGGQVAVFVSRKEKKIFVRQGFVPVFEMPILIDNPDQPLGTHVYTAMEFRDNGTRLRWNVMSMPTELPRTSDTSAKGKKSSYREQVSAPAPGAGRSSNAAEALSRIKIPQEALDRIGEIVGVNSSLVISDYGLGPETGRYTEFIVVTR
jgi:hypothetical protein